ncbi:MAG: serine/threonine protein kinase, partial [Deltaproteobacteria bacterium]|nr:serine/threonine protein kinase [Deltaproteobacteria bacterium]
MIVDELGVGGMGVVYAAYDPELDRRLAIKVLLPSLLGEGRPRLVREAQAIARITHPNVVTVHDVGEVDGSVFVAMELVEGTTLGKWVDKNQPSIPELLDAFTQAGEGLAAAHAADLVHRDFKPDNVLVGHDGRVRVVDFGLARGRGSADSIGHEEHISQSSLDEALTEAGTVMGTPAYMAPEQLGGRLATAASDQFSFCVALYEALYGERPFAGKTIESLSVSVHAGTVRDAPAGRRGPSWLRRVLLTGLQAKPSARYGSMDALLRALARNPVARRRKWLALGTGALAVAAVAYGSGATRERSVCASSANELRAVWNPSRTRAIGKAFSDTALPHAEDTWTRVHQRLSDYTAGWTTQSTEACEATHVDGTQSAELLERRRGCLGERLQRLDAFLTVLDTPDRAVVDRAVRGARGLPDLEGCRDLAALQAGVAPPEQESTRRAVEQLRERTARAEALSSAAKYREEIEILEGVLEEARATGYMPVVATVEHQLARALRSIDDPAGVPLLRKA